jgi:hypothetical protein
MRVSLNVSCYDSNDSANIALQQKTSLQGNTCLILGKQAHPTTMTALTLSVLIKCLALTKHSALFPVYYFSVYDSANIWPQARRSVKGYF